MVDYDLSKQEREYTCCLATCLSKFARRESMYLHLYYTHLLDMKALRRSLGFHPYKSNYITKMLDSEWFTAQG